MPSFLDDCNLRGIIKKMLRRQMSLEHLQIKYPAPWTGKPDIGVVITD